MMAAAEAKHDAQKELAANRSELNLKVCFQHLTSFHTRLIPLCEERRDK
jgi:hypothetical protein